jgi:hypothetical protein
MFPTSVSDQFLLLTTDKPADLFTMADLWDNHSRLPGLLNARDIDLPYVKGYVYDPVKRVYYSPSGRIVSNKRLRAAVGRVSDEAARHARKETLQLVAGSIILAIWYSRMLDLLKALYKTIWLVSIGGFLFDDDTQRNLFYVLMLLQFGYLDNFAQQIESGEQPLDGRAVARSEMYGLHGNTMWQNILIRQAEEDGYTEARRILGINENHCHDSDRPGCIEVAAIGWMPISQMIPLGGCTCYDRCLCSMEFR